MNQDQFINVIGWQKKTFPAATALSKLKHLEEEISEVSIAASFRSNGMEHEFADCFMLLYGAAAEAGLTYNDICNAIDEKMLINEGRVWGEPNANGVVHHVKQNGFPDKINELGNLYESAKDLIAEITPHDSHAFHCADKLRVLIRDMRDMAAVALQKNKSYEKSSEVI